MGELGYDARRTISRVNRPRGCYKTKRGQVFFNRNIAGTDPSGTRYSICQTSGEDTSVDQDLESRVLQSENGSCPSGTSYITTKEECEAAGELYDVEMRRVFNNARRVRGCYFSTSVYILTATRNLLPLTRHDNHSAPPIKDFNRAFYDLYISHRGNV